VSLSDNIAKGFVADVNRNDNKKGLWKDRASRRYNRKTGTAK